MTRCAVPALRKIRGVFADENILPVGRKLAELPAIGTVLYPGHEDIPELPQGAKDTEIFDEIGAGRRDLLFITRDKRIRTRPIERAKLRDAGVRAVFLTGSSNMTQDDIYDLIIKFWDDLAALDSRSGPCSFALTTGGLREVCPRTGRTLEQ